MEPVFGGLLTEAYCPEHKNERLDPSVLVARAKAALAAEGQEDDDDDATQRLKDVEARLTGAAGTAAAGKGRYSSAEEFAGDMAPVLSALEATAPALAEDIRGRICIIRRSLAANSGGGGDGGATAVSRGGKGGRGGKGRGGARAGAARRRRGEGMG